MADPGGPAGGSGGGGGAGERRRILDLLASGRIDAEQAAALLKALGPVAGPRGGSAAERSARVAAQVAAAHAEASAHASAQAQAGRARGISRVLRISIDAPGAERVVRVNVPLALARFAGKFLPDTARAQLQAHGLDLDELFQALREDMPAGRLLDLDVDDLARHAAARAGSDETGGVTGTGDDDDNSDGPDRPRGPRARRERTRIIVEVL